MKHGTAFGLLAGVALDAVFADPRRAHPVAAFGRAAVALENGLYADSRARGAVHVALCVTGAVGFGLAASRIPARTVTTALATWAVLGGTSLRGEALAVSESLGRMNVDAARRRLPHLCGRDPSGLDEEGLARATVESVAENTSDAVVAPLFWGAVAGIPGLLGYRAVNTLDAMIGHRSPRYSNFGWAAARLDDAANWIPARITGLLATACAPLVGGSSTGTYRIFRQDGPAHPSPNAGRCEAAFAGALGVRLGGRNVYGGRVEDRPVLGSGPAPARGDIGRAARLSLAVTIAAAGLAAAGARAGRRRR